MGTKPVRVPESQYSDLCTLAAELDVSLSQATEILLEIGIEQVDVIEHLSLDPDLSQELQEQTEALLEGEWDPSQTVDTTRIYERQLERNKARSQFGPETG